MSRKITATKALIAVGALVGATFGLAPAFAGGTTLTRVTTRVAPLNVATVIGLVGSGFTEDTNYVTFTTGSTTCGTDRVQVISDRQAYVKTPASGCAEGVQVVKLYKGATSPTTSSPGTLEASGPSGASATISFFTAPVLAASNPVLPASASIAGGSAATATVTTALPATSSVRIYIGNATASGKVNPANQTQIFFKVPAGQPGDAAVRVMVNGVSSAAIPATASPAPFTYKSAIKITPNQWVYRGAAPLVRVNGLNFKPTLASGTNTAPTVTFCGVAGTVVTTGTKAYTDRVLYVTPPAWGDSSLVSAGVDATDGGVCTVKVSVDNDGSGAGTATTDSVITSGSSFTYAGY